MRSLSGRRVVVIACGQRDRGDDAVALLAAERLGEQLARDERLARGDGAPPTPEVHLAGGLEVEDVLAIGADQALLVVDAVDGPAPGAVIVRPLASLLPLAGGDAPPVSARDGHGPALGGLAPRSSHAIPIPDVLALAAALRPGLPTGSFIGIGFASAGFGQGLSPAVEAALPALVEAIAQEVRRLRGDPGP